MVNQYTKLEALALVIPEIFYDNKKI